MRKPMRLRTIIMATLAAIGPWSVQPLAAQQPAPAVREAPRTILFVGNSFTFGGSTPLPEWRSASVTDLSGHGWGGVPALFAAFARQAGLPYAVSLETEPGQTLRFHLDQRRAAIDRRWDVVVLQEYSTLDPQRPGDPANYVASVAALASLLHARNPAVRIELVATWSRADLVYRPGSPWSNTPVNRMAEDLYRAALKARRHLPGTAGVVPVGRAWNRAFADGVADDDPYDGIAFGKLDLWGHDQYHASLSGYYLSALCIFARVTGVDPRTLGPREEAGVSLGLPGGTLTALQRIAYEEIFGVGAARRD